MEIVERNMVGKKSQEACEDGIIVTDDFIAVIDGSTSKTPTHLSPDMKNGRFAMVLISEFIKKELKAEASVDDFCQGVSSYIYNKVYKTLGMEERMKLHPEERLTASAIVYSCARREVWMVGDCQALIGGKLYENNKPFDEEICRQTCKPHSTGNASGRCTQGYRTVAHSGDAQRTELSLCGNRWISYLP